MNWQVSQTARCGSSDVRSMLRAMTSGVVSNSVVPPVASGAADDDSADAGALALPASVALGASVGVGTSAAELSAAVSLVADVASALSSSSPPQLAATNASATKPATQARPRKRRFPTYRVIPLPIRCLSRTQSDRVAPDVSSRSPG